MIDFEKYSGPNSDAVFRICARTDEMTSALTTSVKMHCDHCGREVWYSTTQPMARKEDFIICATCASEHLDAAQLLPNNNVPEEAPMTNSQERPLVVVSDEDGHYVGILSLMEALDQYVEAYRQRMNGEALADFFVGQAEYHVDSMKMMLVSVLTSLNNGEVSDNGEVAQVKVFNFDERDPRP